MATWLKPRTITKADIDYTLDRHPRLGHSGGDCMPGSRLQPFDRSELDLDRLQMLMTFLVDNYPVQKTTGKGVHSYGLKHHVENAIGGYVSNGEIALAALLAGYTPEKRTLESRNLRFNIPARHYEALRCASLKLTDWSQAPSSRTDRRLTHLARNHPSVTFRPGSEIEALRRARLMSR